MEGEKERNAFVSQALAAPRPLPVELGPLVLAFQKEERLVDCEGE